LEKTKLWDKYYYRNIDKYLSTIDNLHIIEKVGIGAVGLNREVRCKAGAVPPL